MEHKRMWANYSGALHRVKQAHLIDEFERLRFAFRYESRVFQHIMEYYYQVARVYGDNWASAIGEQHDVLGRLERLEKLVAAIKTGDIVLVDNGKEVELEEFFS